MRKSNDCRQVASTLAQPSTLTRGVVSSLVAEALSQARVASAAIEDRVVPRLPPLKRGPAIDVLRRLESMSMFSDRFVRDLESFIVALDECIDAGTTLHWHADEYHIDGDISAGATTPMQPRLPVPCTNSAYWE